MSEEAENNGGFFSNLKNQIITGVGVVLTTIGGIFIDEVKGFLGLAEEESGAATEVVVESNQQQSQSNNQQVIINIPEQKAAPTQTIVRETVREVPAAQPAPVQVVEEKPETNAERMARLKKMREEKGGN